MLQCSEEKNQEILLLELSIARITFLSFEEKKNLKKNIDSSYNLALLSIEEICKKTNHKQNSRIIWNGKENFRMAQRALFYCKLLHIQILIHSDYEYPELLRQIADPPYLLFCKGNTGLLSEKSISVVGTRRITAEGKAAAKKFAYDACTNGYTIVSGLANGVDGYSHQGCLDAFFDLYERGLDTKFLGSTIAVLPCCIDEVTPASHKKMLSQILMSGGLAVSEYEPKMSMANWHFVQRNRIIAGLSPATVVIEAPCGSGALITADFALESGRDVMFHEACFSEIAKEVNSKVEKDLEIKYALGKVSEFKYTNNLEKYLEAGAPVIKDFSDYCSCLKEIPGKRCIEYKQGNLF